MKLVRGIAAIVAAILCIVFIGCSGDEAKNGALNIVCTIFPQYDIARSIAGDIDNVNIRMLIGPGQDSHDYDPTSKDIAAVHDCDIFIYVGGESDAWVRDMLASVDTEKKSVLSLMDIVDPLEEETVEGMETDGHDHDHGGVGESGQIENVEYDEHVWTSPVNAVKIAEAAADAMCVHMPGAEAVFRKNEENLRAEFLRLDGEFRTLADETESPVIVVADRFPLLYFCREYGIKYYAAFSGCAASTEPSSKTVQFLIDKVKEEGIPAVFKMDMSSGSVAETVAGASGAKILTFYSCHTVGSDDFESGETYVSLMEKNLASLREAFGK